MKVLLMLIVYMFYHRLCWFCFICRKCCQLLSYKSDTCTSFFLPKCPLTTVRSRFSV